MNTVELNGVESTATEGNVAAWRDWLGIVASIGCAIHCAAMPFVFAYLPALGLSFMADESFHKWMALVCFLIAIVAFIPGLRKHGSWVPVSIGAVGLVAITFAAFGLVGQCCSGCSAADSSVAAASCAGACGASCTDGSCTDGSCADAEAASGSCCDGCKETQGSVALADSPTSAAEAAPEKEKDLLGVLAPWITPFGGLLLVSAHLMNRRYGCLCGCCGDNSQTTC